jgi:hypothetical protein
MDVDRADGWRRGEAVESERPRDVDWQASTLFIPDAEFQLRLLLSCLRTPRQRLQLRVRSTRRKRNAGIRSPRASRLGDRSAQQQKRGNRPAHGRPQIFETPHANPSGR